MGKKLRACKSCKKKKGHLEKSSNVSKAFVCKQCGAASTDAKKVCKPVIHDLAYSCEKCGRLSDKAKHLCEPEKKRPKK